MFAYGVMAWKGLAMRIVFHVGMGKTGTSSIQQALAANKAALAARHAHYLGMWFNEIAPRFRGYAGLAAFAAEPAEAQQRHAEAFLAACARHDPAEDATFILSNEGLFGHSAHLAPFFQALIAVAQVRFIVYVRPPRDWLPSAFTQWSIYHKQQKGPIQPFHERARQLIGQYHGVSGWLDNFEPHLLIRRFDKTTDIVADFADALGLPLEPLQQRSLERSEPAEVVLRALYNGRFESPTLPERFDNQMFNTRRNAVTPLKQVMDLCFAYEEMDEIIGERRTLFDAIARRTGINLLDEGGVASAPPPAADAVRERLLDYVIAISIEQSLRINRLERRLEALEKGDD